MASDMLLKELIESFYGKNISSRVLEKLCMIIKKYENRSLDDPKHMRLTERDAMLITYGDQLTSKDKSPLDTLDDFCIEYLKEAVNSIHILPFYPYSSDDGFSVIDYRKTNPALGTWDDITRLGAHFELMFDAVINHASVLSVWFKSFLDGDGKYKDHFIIPDEGFDFSSVVRPRTSPLLTEFEVPGMNGKKIKVWTTFGSDQADLNYKNPEVLLEIIDLLLFYISMGAGFIRLDAIGYLWKESGTSCINLPQTHNVVKLIRLVTEKAASGTKIITETNVPHLDNTAYFGNGTDEAHLVYNFALPPLLIHTIHTGNSQKLSSWAGNLTQPSSGTTFLNFLASHDGIGINPVRGILTDDEISSIIEKASGRGGCISYKNNADGSSIPYEINISYFDALSDPSSQEPTTIQIDRFIAAHAVMLSLAGMPGIYFHSLFGSRSWPEGVKLTGQNRSINRQKFDVSVLVSELSDRKSFRYRVYSGMMRLLKIRSEFKAFDPYGRQEVLYCGDAFFTVKRFSPDGYNIICVHNITDKTQIVDTGYLKAAGIDEYSDLISGNVFTGKTAVTFTPYQSMWIRTE